MNLFPERLTKEKLRELREKRGFTRPALAKKIGYCSHAIYQWEKGINPISEKVEISLLLVLLSK